MPADPVAKLEPPSADAGPRPVRYLAATGLVALLFCASALMVNYTVDPRNAFPPDHYKPLWKDTYDDRLRQWDAMQPAPEVVVFGSSTSLRLEAVDVAAQWNATAFNLAAPGSGPRDYVLVYDYMVRLGRAPDAIILGLDDFLLLDVYWNRAILPSSNAYARVADQPVPLEHTLEELWAAFNPGYLLDSGKVLYYTYIGGYPQARAVGVQPENADGLEDLLAPGVLRIYEDQYQPDVRADPAKVQALQDLIDHAVANGTTVHLVAPPIHPDVLDLVDDSADYDRVHGDAVDFAMSNCGPSVTVHDFLHLESFGGDPVEFENAWHYSAENGRRILAGLREQPGLCPTSEG